MLVTLTKGKKTAKTNRKRYGKNYYSKIGKLSAINKNKKEGQSDVHVSFAKPKGLRTKVIHKITFRSQTLALPRS